MGQGKGLLLSRRNSGLAAGSASYWESCFEAREPVPCFLQPVMDKVYIHTYIHTYISKYNAHCITDNT